MYNRQFYPDLMLDLETLGNEPDSAIVQIGACYFNMATGEIGKKFSMDIDIEDACKYGEITPSTVLWWLQQSKEAQVSVFKNHSFRTSLKKTLEKFTYEMVDRVENVWCHVDFDWPILKHAYKAVGLEFPFKYWMRQDLRTILKLANSSSRDWKNEGIAHNALDDCKFQIKYTVDCLNILKRNDEGDPFQQLST